MLKRSFASACSRLAVVLRAGMVAGQDYPNKPVRIVTAAAGGGSDFTARLIAQGISGPLGQPVIVDNRGSGILASRNRVQGAAGWLYPARRRCQHLDRPAFAKNALRCGEGFFTDLADNEGR